MKLIEALQIGTRAGRAPYPEFRCFLACGFTPLHLLTFFQAHLAKALPQRRLEISTGTYGDLIGSLERLDSTGLHGIAIALEWTDLDARLGARHLGGWRQSVLADIANTADDAATRFIAATEKLADSLPVALSLPSLTLPPAAHTPGVQQSAWEQQLEDLRLGLGNWAISKPGVRLVSASSLNAASPTGGRFDIKSDLTNGFPYTISHADAVGQALAELLAPAPPLKGLITDLDDTLWSGILGEAGVSGISWDLDNRSIIHGLYQQFLSALAERGVLVAIASKNDAGLVEEALKRPDLAAAAADFFPVACHWGPKSSSVAGILEAWNVAADSIIFIDDSPLELAEVKAAHPSMECVLFPKDDPAAVWRLLAELRNRFGKTQLFEEDRLRAHSLKQAGTFRAASGASQDALLGSVGAVTGFTLHRGKGDARSLELINKTNQFNLNGRRLSEGEWKDLLARPEAFLLTVSYRDKFGPLGKIAALVGRECGGDLSVSHWVMSCRAFSRRVEHQSLRYLFDRFRAPRIRFDFAATPRNSPLQECFAEMGIAGPDWILRSGDFGSRCPTLFHQVEEISE